MFTEELRSKVWRDVHSRGVRAFTRFLTPAVFAQAARQAGRRIAPSPLNLVNLVWLGLTGSLDTTKSFAAVLTTTFKILADAPHSPLSQRACKAQPPRTNRRDGRAIAKARSKHDPRRDDPNRVTEEAFVQARGRMPLDFWVALALILADRFASEHDASLRLEALPAARTPMARSSTCRGGRRRWQKHYGTAKGSRGGRVHSSQRLVMLQFPLARVPYRFALGPKSQAEKTMGAPPARRPVQGRLAADGSRLLELRPVLSHRRAARAVFAIRQIAQALSSSVSARWAPTTRSFATRPRIGSGTSSACPKPSNCGASSIRCAASAPAP